MSDNPLGQASRYPDSYAPELLYALERAAGRQQLALGSPLPFYGVDVWNAWELSWLDRTGRPVVATLTVSVPADSPRLVESKSLKLYLNSFAMSRYASPRHVAVAIRDDLSRTVGSDVTIDLKPAAARNTGRIRKLPGRCIDYEDVTCERYSIDASLLRAGGNAVSETLHSHALRSNCPVTGQPDIGSVLITYHGPRIDPGSLFRYIVSYRRHSDFHEQCVERMFVDLTRRCGTEQLTVHAHYNRRGGIDINPFRSNFQPEPVAMRLWRQ